MADMDMDVFPTVETTDGVSFQGRLVVVIDVLRATSSVVAALESGASGVIPVNSMDAAVRLAGGSGGRGSKILVGERRGLPIEGFDLFNSPSEMIPEKVESKTVILFTSNGTRAITSAGKAEKLLICSLNNVGEVAGRIRDEEDIALICSGSEGDLAAEDLLCCGILLEKLGESVDEEEVGDAGRIAIQLSRNHSDNTLGFLEGCDRGRRLKEMGYHRDVEYCSRLDISGLVPRMEGNTIRA